MQKFTEELSGLISAAIAEFRTKLRETEVTMLALDCHPWNGFLELAALTQDEVDQDPELLDPAEMAAWAHHEFSSSLESWVAARGLASEMQHDYDSGAEPREVAVRYFEACAKALTRDNVRREISKLRRAERFRISVADPDDGVEFFPREGSGRCC